MMLLLLALREGDIAGPSAAVAAVSAISVSEATAAVDVMVAVDVAAAVPSPLASTFSCLLR